MRISEQRRVTSPSSPVSNRPRKHAPDYWLLLITVALLAIGLVVVYSISPALAVGKGVDGSTYVTRQVIAIVIGLIMFFVASRIPMEVWKQLAKPLLGLAAIATIITLLLPVNADYPAHRWIRIGGFSFQSVELLKFALIIGVAGFLVQRMKQNQIHDFKATIQPLVITLGVVGFVVAGLQSDLGSAAVIMAILVGMIFVAGAPLARLGMIVAGVLVLGALFIGTSEYRRERVATFLNPSIECADTASGYQACQAMIAVGSGGMSGLGLGNSVQAYGYLPEAENDSIFAIYAEKFGFLGVALLLGLLGALYARIRLVAVNAADDFSRLVVLGILVWLSVQALVNIAAMLGMIPLKGITLPLISYGGSSVLMILAALGVVFHVSRYTHFSNGRNSSVRRETDESSRYGRRVRGTYHTPLGSRR